MRILVVSDVRVVQEGLHSVLEQQNGVDMISTVDMQHATDRSAQLNPDIVLFDAAPLESIGIVKELLASSPHTKGVAFGVMARPLEDADGNDNGQACAMPLSPSELQIAHLLETGLTNKAIGRQLGIEAATVKNHLHNMCEKLKVHRRGEIAARFRSILGVSPAAAFVPQ